MNNEKVGKLIYDLRKEKGYTQKQLADKMLLSDRTISKWERGLGCPDVSLLPQLSEILEVNIEKILLGDLEENRNDEGSMKRIKFYSCPSCGNILTETGSGDISCCGRKLEPLEPKPCDDEHYLEVFDVEDDYYITFNHDMSKGHYLNFIACVGYDRLTLVRLYPEQGGEVRFPKDRGGTIYFGCTNHGLWVHQ